eukprot:COSAG02_NODE_21372_length_790_cov_21.923300_2_plen_57_part_01
MLCDIGFLRRFRRRILLEYLQGRDLTGGTRIRDGVRSMNSESEYRIPIQPVMRDSFD